MIMSSHVVSHVSFPFGDRPILRDYVRFREGSFFFQVKTSPQNHKTLAGGTLHAPPVGKVDLDVTRGVPAPHMCRSDTTTGWWFQPL